jgi:RimJ/RimL family protein N-acetyltransferase
MQELATAVHRAAATGPEAFASFAASTRIPACRPDSYASPGLADAWAQAVIACWQAAYAAGQLDLAEPLYLLDLAPGKGHLAKLLLRALHQHLPAMQHPMREECLSIRYLACITPGSDTPTLDDNRFDTVSWSPFGTPIPSYRHAYRWFESCNPVIVLALNYLQAFPSQLRAVHDGSWLEGCVHVAAEDRKGCELDYEWREMVTDDPYCPTTLRQRYLRTLSHSCVLIPDACLYALQRIGEMTHGHFLWLAADQGVIDEKQLRFGAMSPPSAWSYEAQHIPVNFHALAYEQGGQGAWCWHGQPHENGVAVQAIWRHDGVSIAHRDYAKVADQLRRFLPSDAAQLETLASALSPENSPALHLTLLRSAHYDPRVLRSTLAAWMENPPELSDAERGDWGNAVVHAWQVCPGDENETNLRYSLALLAVQLGRLDVARDIFKRDSNMPCQALCYSMGGRADLALLCIEGIDDPSAVSLRDHLRQRMQRWQMLGWYHAEDSYDDELCLVPLDEEHGRELYEQYLDPQIGELTRLPELDTPEAASEWIAEQSQEAGRVTYALMHVDMGLIGVASSQIHGEDGYFYFWIGSAHQGNGFGRRAGHLLCLQAERLGVRRLFTSAYQTNHRSIDALHVLGFHQLPLRAVSPDDDLLFFVRDAQRDSEVTVVWRECLASLLAANKSPIRLSS